MTPERPASDGADAPNEPAARDDRRQDPTKESPAPTSSALSSSSGRPEAPPGATSPGRAGTSTFTIEGRAAPGLFVVGWLATIMGAAILVAGLFAGGDAAIGLALAGLVVLLVGLVAGAGSQAIERRARGIAGYAGPSPLLVFAAVVPLTILLQVAVAVPLSALGIDEASPLASLVGLVLTAVAYFGLLRLLVVGTGALSWRDMGLRPPGGPQVAELAVGALMGFPLLVITGILATVLATFLPTPPSTLPLTGGVAGMLVNLVTAALVAPVAEETFFRGFATTAWLRRVGVESAIVRGALFFAAAHILTVGGDTFALGAERALFAFVARLPVALALGWVFVRSRSLYASIGLHALFNGLPFVAYLLIGRG